MNKNSNMIFSYYTSSLFHHTNYVIPTHPSRCSIQHINCGFQIGERSFPCTLRKCWISYLENITSIQDGSFLFELNNCFFDERNDQCIILTLNLQTANFPNVKNNNHRISAELYVICMLISLRWSLLQSLTSFCRLPRPSLGTRLMVTTNRVPRLAMIPMSSMLIQSWHP